MVPLKQNPVAASRRVMMWGVLVSPRSQRRARAEDAKKDVPNRGVAARSSVMMWGVLSPRSQRRAKKDASNRRSAAQIHKTASPNPHKEVPAPILMMHLSVATYCHRQRCATRTPTGLTLSPSTRKGAEIARGPNTMRPWLWLNFLSHSRASPSFTKSTYQNHPTPNFLLTASPSGKRRSVLLRRVHRAHQWIGRVHCRQVPDRVHCRTPALHLQIHHL